MRKFLIMLLIVILLIALGLMLAQGLSIGKFRINSIKNIIDDNKNLDEEIATLSYSINNDYEAAKTNLQTSFQKLMTAKQNYQDSITFSTEEEIKAANQTEKYKLDYLWTKIGFYATKNNIIMQANVSYGSSGVEGQYNISFTATGEYISISEFIYAIENDSNLGFKIEEFNMVPYTGIVLDESGNTVEQDKDLLQASFIVKNIPIDKDSITTVQPVTTSNVSKNQDTTEEKSTTEDQSTTQEQ